MKKLFKYTFSLLSASISMCYLPAGYCTIWFAQGRQPFFRPTVDEKREWLDSYILNLVDIENT